MSPSVNILFVLSFSFCFFQADGVLEASVRIGVDTLLEIMLGKILHMHISN